MDRRKRAFATLAISLFLSICVFSCDFVIALPEILGPSLLIFAMVLMLLIVFFNKILDNQSYLRISLSESELEWKFKNSRQKYVLPDIKSLRIKRTTKGFIREIRIGLSGMKYLFINGLEDFEKFKDDVTSTINNVHIKRY